MDQIRPAGDRQAGELTGPWDWISARQLCRHGIARRTLDRHARRQGWQRRTVDGETCYLAMDVLDDLDTPAHRLRRFLLDKLAR